MAERRPTHILSSYYAPRGHNRMYALGIQLAQQYLSPNDKLIGINNKPDEWGFVGDCRVDLGDVVMKLK